MGYITPQGLEALKNYKYISGGYSQVDKVMNHFWEAFVKLIPLSVAPNLITLVGLIINIAGALLLVYNDTTLTVNLPNWMYLTAGFCLFAYQTLDAVDGKQARRTGSSSPLGQLFDHGCDSVSTFFGLIMYLQALQSGSTWVSFAFGFCILIPFYTQQWEEYHAHVLRTFIGKFGVTEGMLITIGIIMSAGITHGAIASFTLGQLIPASFGLPPNIQQIKIIEITAVIGIYNSLVYVYNNITYALERTHESKPRALAGLIPLALFMLEVWAVFSTEWAYKNPSLTILLFIPSYCLMTCRHIVCSMCKMQFNFVQKHVLIYALFPLNKVILRFLPALKQFKQPGSIGDDLVPEAWVAGFVFVVTLVLFMKFTVGVINQITSYLNIYCLTIKKKPIKTQ